MKNGPELWNAILAQMPPGAVIAGGAVRDYLLGVEPKDIDVFCSVHAVTPISYFSGNEADVMPDWLPEGYDCRHGLFRVDDRHERQEEYTKLNNIAVVSCGTVFEYKVDLIEMNIEAAAFNGTDLVADFDFAITRCFYDGTDIFDTIEAAVDRQNKTVTLMIDDRRERSQARFDRFNERRGGGWTYRDELVVV